MGSKLSIFLRSEESAQTLPRASFSCDAGNLNQPKPGRRSRNQKRFQRRTRPPLLIPVPHCTYCPQIRCGRSALARSRLQLFSPILRIRG